MKERPILFSAPMVRAILDGRKSQTRRVMKPQPPPECGIHFMLGNESWLPEEDKAPLRHHWEAWGGELYRVRPKNHMCGIFTVRCPYGVPGDRLWVRETCMPFTDGRGENKALYKATGDVASGSWHPSIHMPRWASRITLEITDVRVQRVQEISEEDAQAEGVEPTLVSMEDIADTQISDAAPHIKELARLLGPGRITAKHNFSQLWDSINGKTHPWANNDWVWCVSFRRAA